MNEQRKAQHALNPLQTIRLVAGREIAERLHSRLIWIMTALTTLLVVALIVIPTLIHQPTKPTVVGLVESSAQALGTALQTVARAAKVDISVVDVANSTSARSDLQQGTIDVALSVAASGAVAEVRGSVGYFQVQTLEPAIQAVLQATLDVVHQRTVLAHAGVPLATVRSAMAPVPFTTTSLHSAPTDQIARDIAALATGILLYVTLAIYGVAVASGVAQEKTSRMAEVLLATVRPGHLLIGKVVGIGMSGAVQLGIAVIVGLLTNVLVRSTNIPSTIWALLPIGLIWFVLGYALYAFGYAATGAMVGRQEEVQFASLPITLPIVAGFLLTYLTIAAPDATWLRAVSFLPPLAPILMPARLALGTVSAWEMVLAIALMLGAIYAMERLAARIYAPALVHGGTRLSWGDALRLPTR